MKKTLFLLALSLVLVGCGEAKNETTNDVKEETKAESKTETKEESEKETEIETEIEKETEKEIVKTPQENITKIIKNNQKEYKGIIFSNIDVNNNYGTEDIEDDYIVVVHTEYSNSNKIETVNKFSKMYSDDMVARLGKETNKVPEISIIFEDTYNKRKIRYKYEYKDNGYYLKDTIMK